MIIGNGDIATVLKEVDRKDLLFFASGVSNSQETRGSEFNRELDLMLDQDYQNHVVYFSSLAVLWGDTPYLQHKHTMELTVKRFFRTYTIVRLGNIDWGKNPHTLINFLRNKKNRLEELDIQDVYRHVVSKDEFLYWMNLIPNWSCEMNIPGRMLKVKNIVEEYVE